MADCLEINCDTKELTIHELFLMNVKTTLINSGKNIAFKAIEYTEDSSAVDCSVVSKNQYDVFLSCFRRDGILRAVIDSSGSYYSVSCSDNVSLETLLNLSVVRTTDGCNAIRVKEVNATQFLSCEEPLGYYDRMRSSFWLSSDKKKAAMIVKTTSYVGDFATCSNDKSFETIVSNLFSNKFHGTYAPLMTFDVSPIITDNNMRLRPDGSFRLRPDGSYMLRP